MSPLFFAAAALAALSFRQCPKCGHRQHVGPAQRQKTVRCSNCGNDIPLRQGEKQAIKRADRADR